MTAARAPPPASGLPALPLTCGLFSTNLCSFRRDTLTMNTIKPGLLGAALLALAGLCNQPARADGTYTATANGVTPQSGSYPINHGYYGSSTTPASIPIAVAKQSVQVNGATPSRTIIVGWSMNIQLQVHTPSGSNARDVSHPGLFQRPLPQRADSGSNPAGWLLAASSEQLGVLLADLHDHCRRGLDDIRWFLLHRPRREQQHRHHSGQLHDRGCIHDLIISSNRPGAFAPACC